MTQRTYKDLDDLLARFPFSISSSRRGDDNGLRNADEFKQALKEIITKRALEITLQAYQLAGYVTAYPECDKPRDKEKEIKLLDLLAYDLPEALGDG